MLSKIRELRKEKQRQKLLTKLPKDSPLLAYLDTPLPALNTPIKDVSFLALDFETTGLNAQNEEILSVGFTVIENNKIKLSESGHQIIKPNREIPSKSIIIHGITHGRMSTGLHLLDVLEALFEKMAGRVLLVHFKQIETTFLRAFCKRQYGHEIPLRIVDTLAIEKRSLDRRGNPIGTNQLRLFNLRRNYGLPRYKAHNSMIDALATAERLLAQITYRGDEKLSDLI